MFKMPWNLRDPSLFTLNEVHELTADWAALKEWQTKACQLAQQGDFDGLATHLMIPDPTVSVGQWVKLEGVYDFIQVENIDMEHGLIDLADGSTHAFEKVREVKDEHN